jgi:transcriptional regulator with XRE-family HTH domain
MKNWRELRDKYITSDNEVEVAAAAADMLAEVRAYRLAEARKQRDLTQEQVAEAMGVSQTRVSQIERGEIRRSEIDTLASYINALGGRLEIVANFGDQLLVLDDEQPKAPTPAAQTSRRKADRSKKIAT